jgi:hypothetical protein
MQTPFIKCSSSTNTQWHNYLSTSNCESGFESVSTGCEADPICGDGQFLKETNPRLHECVNCKEIDNSHNDAKITCTHEDASSFHDDSTSLCDAKHFETTIGTQGHAHCEPCAPIAHSTGDHTCTGPAGSTLTGDGACIDGYQRYTVGGTTNHECNPVGCESTDAFKPALLPDRDDLIADYLKNYYDGTNKVFADWPKTCKAAELKTNFDCCNDPYCKMTCFHYCRDHEKCDDYDYALDADNQAPGVAPDSIVKSYFKHTSPDSVLIGGGAIDDEDSCEYADTILHACGTKAMKQMCPETPLRDIHRCEGMHIVT